MIFRTLSVLIFCLPTSLAWGQSIIAHRGASHDAPENTLAAFRLAWERGADGVEGDFYLSSDGRIVCIHDRDTKRVAGKTLVVAETTYADLRLLDVGAWKAAKWQGEKIPTIEEVIATIPPGKKFFIELKVGPEIVEPLAKILEASPLRPEQIVIIAFSEETIIACEKRLPHLKTQWLTGYKDKNKDKNKHKTGPSFWTPTADTVAATLLRIGADGLGSQAVPAHFDKTFVARLHADGIDEFGVWTVDDANVAKYYQKLGAAAITTNRPGWLRKQLRMKWWREARFGMFVHWGLYSGLAGTWEGKPVGTRGGMEWIQQRVKADTDTYSHCAIPLFKPKQGFARLWAKLAKQAGCQYLVFTTKHHDGFALHDSEVSDFDAGSVLNRDLVREIVDACRAEGLRVGFYHSMIDWHHDQYAYGKSKQLPHPLRGRPYPNGTRDHAKYVDYLHAEVDELVSHYGPIDILWWDYSAVDFQGDEAWRATDLIQAVRSKQPDIIINNRLFRIPEAGFSGMGTAAITPQLDPKYGDFITPEQHIPATGMPGVDWETCMTMNTTWGFSKHDHAWKSNATLIRNLIDIASKGGNYLLNIGPKGDGSIPKQSIASMQAVGTWMKANGESIFATTASPFENLDWGRSTQKRLPGGKKRLFLHVFDWPTDGKLNVPLRTDQPIQARLLVSAAPLDVAVGEKYIIVTVPKKAPDDIATVIALDIE